MLDSTSGHCLSSTWSYSSWLFSHIQSSLVWCRCRRSSGIGEKSHVYFKASHHWVSYAKCCRHALNHLIAYTDEDDLSVKFEDILSQKRKDLVHNSQILEQYILSGTLPISVKCLKQKIPWNFKLKKELDYRCSSHPYNKTNLSIKTSTYYICTWQKGWGMALPCPSLSCWQSRSPVSV